MIKIGETLYLTKNRKFLHSNINSNKNNNNNNNNVNTAIFDKISANNKNSSNDTNTNSNSSSNIMSGLQEIGRTQQLPVYKNKSEVTSLGEIVETKCMIYACLYPIDAGDFNKLSDGIKKLCLNDASVEMIEIISEALGSGFRCGFLGLLHMEVFQQRLENDIGIEIIVAAPTITYKYLPKQLEFISLFFFSFCFFLF